MNKRYQVKRNTYSYTVVREDWGHKEGAQFHTVAHWSTVNCNAPDDFNKVKEKADKLCEKLNRDDAIKLFSHSS